MEKMVHFGGKRFLVFWGNWADAIILVLSAQSNFLKDFFSYSSNQNVRRKNLEKYSKSCPKIISSNFDILNFDRTGPCFQDIDFLYYQDFRQPAI